MLFTSPVDLVVRLRGNHALLVLIPWRSRTFWDTEHVRIRIFISTYFVSRMNELPYVVSLALLIWPMPVELYICLAFNYGPILVLLSFYLPCPLILFGFLKNLLWSFKSTWTYLNPFFDHLQGTRCIVALSLSFSNKFNYSSSSIINGFMRGEGDLHVILFCHSITESGSGVCLFIYSLPFYL